MKFGKVNDPSLVDFTLPATHPETYSVLSRFNTNEPFEVYIGCAKWNKTDLKGFYPKGTKDELEYYAKQFNSIELNATYYNTPSKDQIVKWKEKTTPNFKFFPKITQSISHYSRLLNTDEKVMVFTDAVAMLEEKLGMIFLQMHENFKPKDFDRLAHFLQTFPKGFPLAVEVRNEEWFADQTIFNNYCQLLEQTNKTNIIVDTAGRRDMLHMRLTSPVAFVRYVSANDDSDEKRLNDWLDIIEDWRANGLQQLYFFIHQNLELESPMIATQFIQKVNTRFNLDLPYQGKNDLVLF
mgnify:FL=1